MTIANRDITVVVQGPVQALPEREMEEGSTARCLGSVRRHLPGAKIVLSTWPGQSLDGLDCDELLICKDPGSTVMEYRADGRPCVININRQIVSSCEGLKRATTRYAMKLRSDNFLIGDSFKRLQQAFPKRAASCRFLDERVVVANTLTIKFRRSLPIVFYACDFFYFGLTRDLLRLWDLPLFEDLPFDADCLGMRQSASFPGMPLSTEQVLWTTALQKFDPAIRLAHKYHATRTLQRISDLCYANNLVIDDPERIGLGLCGRHARETRQRWRSRIFAFHRCDWLHLYRRHCAPGFVIPDDDRRQFLRLRMLRLLLVRIQLPLWLLYRWLERRWRELKRARRHRQARRRGGGGRE